MKGYKPYLQHILDEADYLKKHSSNIDYESFIYDETLRRSFIRSIEIIGEAVKKLPENIKNTNSSIPWKKIAGMRGILIHEYFGVNYKLVWDVVKNKIPELKLEIEKLLSYSNIEDNSYNQALWHSEIKASNKNKTAFDYIYERIIKYKNTRFYKVIYDHPIAAIAFLILWGVVIIIIFFLFIITLYELL